MEPEKTKSETATAVKSIIRALRHRNFRLFFGGQSISLIGTWMQRIALGWLVYRLTSSPFLLGFVGFAGQIPIFLLASFAGVLADRWNRQRILILTQTLAMIQAFILSSLVLTGTILIWHIILLSISLGIIMRLCRKLQSGTSGLRGDRIISQAYSSKQLNLCR